MKGLLIFGMIILVLGCIQASTIPLGTVEVREYKGEKLSSIDDLKDNAINGPQYINISNYTLKITGLVVTPKAYTYEQALDHQKYSKVVTLNCVEGWSATLLWEGVLVRDLMDEAGVKPEANTVIFHAYDGYTTSLPLSYIRDNNIILAYAMNNITIPPQKGYPFMLVAESKWGYKWIKWVTEIELSGDPSYKGYWESGGYSQNGDVNGSKFE